MMVRLIVITVLFISLVACKVKNGPATSITPEQKVSSQGAAVRLRSSPSPNQTVAPPKESARLTLDAAKRKGLKIRNWPGVDYKDATFREGQLGTALSAGLVRNKVIETDSEAAHLLQVPLPKLAAVSHRPHLRYEAALIESSVINAYSSPDGKLFITTAMMNLFHSEDEVAAVLAHEIAHVCAKHSMKRLRKRQEIKLYRDLAIYTLGVTGQSQRTIDIADIGTAAAGRMIELKYSRDMEYEADQLAVIYMKRAGYDPAAMPRVLGLLRTSRSGKIAQFFKTHPDSRSRIKQTQLFVDADVPDQTGKPIPMVLTVNAIRPSSQRANPYGPTKGLAIGASPRKTMSGQAPTSWKGLTPCVSTLDQVIKTLGKPGTTQPGFDKSSTMRFSQAGLEAQISTDGEVVKLIEIWPESTLTQETLEATVGDPLKKAINDHFRKEWHYADGRIFVFKKDNATVDRIVYGCATLPPKVIRYSARTPPPFTMQGTPWHNFGPPDFPAMIGWAVNGIRGMF